MKIFLDFAVLITIYFLFFRKKWAKEGKDVLFINTLMFIYLSFVIYFTLMPFLASLPHAIDHLIVSHQYPPMNLTPFVDVLYSRGDFARQITLNIIMTIPFGFLLPLVRNRNPSLLKTTLCTFLLNFGIELLQLLLRNGRSSDITDVITNVIGGVIGYIFYLLFKPLTAKVLDYIKNK